MARGRTQPQGFLLSAEGHEQLEQLRDQLLPIAGFVFAATSHEEHMPLEIRRSMLGQLLESFGLRIDDALTSLEWVGRRTLHPLRRH